MSISKLLPLKMKTILLVLMGCSLALTGCDPIVTIEQKSGDFSVEMPSENQPDNDDAASVEFVVSIEKNGEFVFESETINPSKLESHFAKLTDERASPTLVIRRGVNVPYERVMDLLELATNAGIQSVKFE